MKILLLKNMKKQKHTLLGTMVLLSAAFLAVSMALFILVNTEGYAREAMDRTGYGDLTAWVNSEARLTELKDEIEQVAGVERVTLQPLIFSGYQIDGRRSDSDGQLLVYEPEAYPYGFLSRTLDGYQEAESIEPGTILISPALKSTFDIEIGDEIRFSLSRGTGAAAFRVGGYFEDPFMGGAMVDMKSFLISREDYESVIRKIGEAPALDVLAREGAMVHITKEEGSKMTDAELGAEINRQTGLSSVTEFVYTKTAMEGFMVILQRVFTGFLCAFGIILFVVALLVLGHSISSAIEMDSHDLAILKTIGYTGWQLRILQMFQYATGVVGGVLFGGLCAVLVSARVPGLLITSTGILMPSRFPWGFCLLAAALILIVLVWFIYAKTARIMEIAPIQVINGGEGQSDKILVRNPVTGGRGLIAQLAHRQLLTGRRRYVSVFLVAAFLVLFLSIVGKMGVWLGADGEGLMDAFSVADHDIGVQPTHEINMEEVENMILSYAGIQGHYQVAMEPVDVNGINYTANVIDTPEYFHVLSGRTCINENEIVITELVAQNLGIEPGDSVTVTSGQRNDTYVVSGIYQCANETGANIGMSREGYARIADVSGYIWCHHYILWDSGQNEEIMEALNQRYRLDADIHTNSWSGLGGIVEAMHLMVFMMYGIAIICMIVTMLLTGNRFLYVEQRNMAVFKSIGFTTGQLRRAFALRFGMAVFAGAVVGIAVSRLLADRIISTLIRTFGISEFHSGFGLLGDVMPVLAVTVLFSFFAYIAAGKLKQSGLVQLIRE